MIQSCVTSSVSNIWISSNNLKTVLHLMLHFSFFLFFISRNELQTLQLSTIIPVLCCHCVIESWNKLCSFIISLSCLWKVQQKWGEGNTSGKSRSPNYAELCYALRLSNFGVCFVPAPISTERNWFIWVDKMALKLQKHFTAFFLLCIKYYGFCS